MTIITVGYHFGSGYGADSKPARKYIKQELFKSPRDLFSDPELFKVWD